MPPNASAVTLEVDIDNISMRSPHQRPPSADTATTESSETASPQRWLIRHDPKGDVEAGNSGKAALDRKVAAEGLQNGNASRERSTTYEEDDDDPWNKVVILEDNSPAWASELNKISLPCWLLLLLDGIDAGKEYFNIFHILSS